MWELVCDVIADNGKKKTSMDRNPKQRVAAFVLALQEWLETNVS